MPAVPAARIGPTVARVLALIVLILINGAAYAAPDQAALAAYESGDYAKAVALGGDSPRAEDRALAARALNAVAYFERDRKQARRIADDAYDAAQAAIALDPALPEAHLQAAIALALKGAHTSPALAFITGLPRKARRRIDAALALDPGNAWAVSTSAAWRIEVARRGGASIDGADPVRGHEEFLKARSLAPDNPTIAYECALRLLAAGRPEWRADALAALADALAAAPATAFERDVQKLARALAAAVAQGPAAERQFIESQP